MDTHDECSGDDGLRETGMEGSKSVLMVLAAVEKVVMVERMMMVVAAIAQSAVKVNYPHTHTREIRGVSQKVGGE